jgi:hypothetical protein
MGVNERDVPIGEVSLERMARAVEKVRNRLLRAASALERAKVPYAVVGGNAVAAWVARVDESAVRNTQDVDIVLRRADLEAATKALGQAGFVNRHLKGVDMFLDGPEARARDAVYVVFAGEKVRPEYDLPVPDVAEAEEARESRLLKLEPLVQMKLTSFRRKDQVHLLDLASVGLIDESWVMRVPVELKERLQQLLDSPDR